MPAPTPEWWQVVSPHLDRALELSTAARTVWLAALREQHPDVASEIETLLEEHGALIDDGFLERDRVPRPSAPFASGDAIGAYRLSAPIGEGGMGAVWLAERTGDDIQQRVAIKFLGASGLRPGWHARFLKERRLLASLNHPAIVRVIDAGANEGRPYLVMEYVDGSPIDIHASRLSLDERLKLFLSVCDGVSHAHRHLIIHRDLKPSNILVDAAGQPKLLDFGIAKLLDDREELTATLDRVLTPKYASPEQFRGAAQTTATDVYSLGAVLYKIVTGRSPHDAANGASPADLMTGSREVPAPRTLRPDLPTDLDYILRKALRSEANERYGSVDAFANDIRALLDSRPVDARAGDRWYRARKVLRRYRVPVTAAALVIVSMALGLYLANRERVIAERRFQQVRQLANEFFALDARIQALPGATDARRQIVSTSIGYLEALGKEARDDRGLALEIAEAYLQVARVQGVPTGSNLGDFERADETLVKAEHLIDSVLAADPANHRALRVSTEVAHDRMILANGESEERQLAEARKATRQVESLVARGASADEVVVAANLLVNVSLAYYNLAHYAEAIAASKKAVDISRTVDSKDAQRARGRALARLAEELRTAGELSQALQAVREARPLVEGADYRSEQQRNVAMDLVLAVEGAILANNVNDGIGLERIDEAIEPWQQAFDLMERLAAADRNDSQSRYLELSNGIELAVLVAARDPRRALDIYEQALRRVRETRGNSNRTLNEAEGLARSAVVLCRLSRLREARDRIDSAFAMAKSLIRTATGSMDIDRTVTLALIDAKASYEEQDGRRDDAIATRQGLVDDLVRRSRLPPESNLVQASRVSRLYRELARMHRAAGRPAAAAKQNELRLKLWQLWAARMPDNEFVTREERSATAAASER